MSLFPPEWQLANTLISAGKAAGEMLDLRGNRMFLPGNLLFREYKHVFQERFMLWTIFVILLVLWLVGLVSFHAIGAYIHILLVLAIVVLLIQLITGRRSAL